jgi:hypothetical protein
MSDSDSEYTVPSDSSTASGDLQLPVAQRKKDNDSDTNATGPRNTMTEEEYRAFREYHTKRLAAWREKKRQKREHNQHQSIKKAYNAQVDPSCEEVEGLMATLFEDVDKIRKEGKKKSSDLQKNKRIAKKINKSLVYAKGFKQLAQREVPAAHKKASLVTAENYDEYPVIATTHLGPGKNKVVSRHFVYVMCL